MSSPASSPASSVRESFPDNTTPGRLFGNLVSKFGWSTIISSIILTPIFVLWSKLFAFPFWLMRIFKHEKITLRKFRIQYPDHENGWVKELYTSATHPIEGCRLVGWNVFADADGDGGAFYESFFGVIQVLNLEDVATAAEGTDQWLLKPNFFLSWFPAEVLIDFNEPNRHTVTIDIETCGPNRYNPFFWLTTAYVLASLSFASWGYEPLKEELNATVVYPGGDVVAKVQEWLGLNNTEEKDPEQMFLLTDEESNSSESNSYKSLDTQ